MVYMGYLVGLFGVMLVMAVMIIIRNNHEIWKLKEACDNYKLSLGIQDRDKKQMVELLGRVCIDISHTGRSLHHDTIKELEKWVNG